MKLFAEIVLIVNVVIFLAVVFANEAYRSLEYIIVALLIAVANLIVLLWLFGAIHG